MSRARPGRPFDHHTSHILLASRVKAVITVLCLSLHSQSRKLLHQIPLPTQISYDNRDELHKTSNSFTWNPDLRQNNPMLQSVATTEQWRQTGFGSSCCLFILEIKPVKNRPTYVTTKDGNNEDSLKKEGNPKAIDMTNMINLSDDKNGRAEERISISSSSLKNRPNKTSEVNYSL